MRFYIDTEFIERGRYFPIQLISIGIVCENGEEYYAESAEFDPETANEWVRENVLTHLTGLSSPIAEIAADVVEFVSANAGESKPEFWGYYCDYDWVVLCQMFGTMMSLPKGWPMYCRDLKQLCDGCGNPKLPTQESTEHNALADARWNRQIYDFLTPEVADESQKCAADICRYCKDGDEIQRIDDGPWMHVFSAALGGKKLEQKIPCRASAIHERIRIAQQQAEDK